MENAAIVIKIKNIVEHPNADKLQIAKLFGTQILIGLETKVDDILVYVDSNLKMSHDFLHNNNLYRHCEWNKDKTKTGFFEDHGRVKCLKLRGEISDGFLFPVDYLDFAGSTNFGLGDEFNFVDGTEICSKYVPKIQQGSGGKNKQAVKKLKVPMFKEHFSTSQFMREQHQIPAGTVCYIEEKIHGTSHRSGHVQFSTFEQAPWWKKILYKLVGIKDIVKWIYLNGTRRVIHTPNKDHASFHDNTMREEVLENVRGSLLKGEEIYLELFGHEKTGSQIQKGFPYNTNPKDKKPYRSLLYRVTMNNEDGQTVDYNREAVYAKANELGIEKPHLFEKFYYNGSEESMQDLETRVIEYAQGKSITNLSETKKDEDGETWVEVKTSDTLREGVVIWFIDSSGHWKALKYKSDAFRLKESGNKDKGIVDQEDVN